MLFFGVFPCFMFYGWLRYFVKQLFDFKPVILFSFLGIPMNYLTAKAVKKQGYPVYVWAISCPKVFAPMKYGFNLEDHPLLKRFLIVGDYLPLFLVSLIKFDIYEFNFNGGLLMYSRLRNIEPLLLKIAGKKVVIYGYGSDCKVLADVKKQGKYNNAMDRDGKDEGINDGIIRGNLRRARKYANILIAGGDLIHLGPKAIFLPLAIDFSFWEYIPLKKKTIVTFIHSTNHRTHKGSRFIINAFERLKKTKMPVELTLVEGKTVAECKKLYQKGDIFITDVVTGWHGLTACEAMFMGRPVISYLRPDIAKFHYYYAKDIPIVSANPVNLKRQIIRLTNDYNLRKELGRQGREYVQKVHSLETVGKLRTFIYEYIWQGKKINQNIFEKEVLKRRILV